MIEKYYRLLEKNKKEIFDRAFEIAKEIKRKAKKYFRKFEIYIGGSFARNEHTLSSDLDIIIVSEEIPERMKFEEYYEIIKNLYDDLRVNIHLLNKNFFEKNRKLYRKLIKV